MRASVWIALACGALLATSSREAAACGNWNYQPPTWTTIHGGTLLAGTAEAVIDLSLDTMFAIGDISYSAVGKPIKDQWSRVQLGLGVAQIIATSALLYAGNTGNSTTTFVSGTPAMTTVADDQLHTDFNVIEIAKLGIALILIVRAAIALDHVDQPATRLRLVPLASASTNGQTAGLSAAGVF